MNSPDQNINITTIEQLFKQHYRRLCNVANGIINDRVASEDIVQEVFSKLWNKKEEIQITSTSEGYLIRATSNAALNYLKANKRMIPVDYSVPGSWHNRDSFTPEKALAYTELQGKIKTALDKLPPRCKMIFTLSRFEGMKYREIAEHLDISVKTVENQMGIALEKLRNDLKPYLTKEFITIAVSIGITMIFHLLSFFLIAFLI